MDNDGSETKTDEELGQIREIIFGRQMRDYDHRFSRLQESLTKTSSDVRSALEARVATVQGLLDSSVLDSGERFGEVNHQIEELRKQTESRLADLDEAVDRMQIEFRDSLSKLRDELTVQNKEMLDAAEARWSNRAQQMQTSKADRSQLAELFEGLARKINMPPPEGPSD